MKNIEQFKFYASLWLAFLYETFPNPNDIDVRWAEGKDYEGKRKFKSYQDVINSWDEYSMGKDNPVEQEFWTSQSTLIFLIKEEYIRTSTSEDDMDPKSFVFSNCVLTEKGLKMLMSKTGIDQRSFGEKLIEYLKEGKYSSLLRLVKFW
ncbi:hypothetical protein QQ215_004581 [Vibrio vulnificus]|nr:hypothetical protein [Vibrio vulnificus]ASC57208.1 hypothetical protein FORC37_1514 [Vibrio vulnificus]ASC57221.1 hypothetical protein FORC37_1527 [Vibrio vulnificus]EIV1855779.1 hypothetical protein [Vibrio vulnificus]ELC9718879.1 hypothetical protein [Vibrio vulnificus]ELI0612485.1 hypothetical protein [Vibrio vulnificus]